MAPHDVYLYKGFYKESVLTVPDRVMHGVSSNSPLPPSVETAYYRKCIELKRRINEIEDSNDSLRVRKIRTERAILKMRLERCFLLEKIAQTMKENPDDSDQSNSPPPTVSYTTHSFLSLSSRQGMILINLFDSRKTNPSVPSVVTAPKLLHHQVLQLPWPLGTTLLHLPVPHMELSSFHHRKGIPLMPLLTVSISSSLLDIQDHQ